MLRWEHSAYTRMHGMTDLSPLRHGARPFGLAAVALLAFGAPRTAPAQAPRPDYARADRIRTVDPLVVGGRLTPTWFADSVRFHYRATAGADRGKMFVVDPRARTRLPLFDHARVAASLSAAADTTIAADGIPGGRLVDGDRAMRFELRGRTLWCALATGRCSPPASAQVAAQRRADGPEWALRSPDGRWDAFIWNYNVYVRPARVTDADSLSWRNHPRPHVRNGCDAPAVPGPLPPRDSLPLPRGSIALSTDGTTRRGFGVYEFGIEVARVDAKRFLLTQRNLQWSPDSRRLTARRDDLRGVRIYPLYSSTSNQPVDHSYFYAVPGDSLVPRYDSFIFDLATRSAVRVRVPQDGLLNSDGVVRWGRSADELFVVNANRGPTTVTLSQVNPTTGAPRAIVRESLPTFAELPSGAWSVAPASGDVFVVSQRDGWGQLYRYGLDGVLKNRVDSGAYRVAQIIRVDSARRQLFFTAWGKEPGVPYYAHLYRVNFDGSGMTSLTPEEGNHTIVAVPGAPYFLDTWSTIGTPPTTALRAADGERILELERGDDAPLRAVGWTPSEVFTVKARDGATDLWGVMHKPSDFDPARKYPIVAVVYPGPQIGSVGDWVFKGADARRGVGEHLPSGSTQARIYSGDGMRRALAELGFIVIQLDAMGTAKRSKAFEDFYHGNVRDNGLPDQVAGIRQLAARHPWIDTSRVGVWGHSGGGYSAGAAMLDYPDFFKVGVSQSGNHDFRVYGWYWGEKYQGAYRRQGASDNYEDEANYKHAAKLKGKLLVMSGDMDCNNPPAETLRLIDALVREGKEFDMLLVPDHGHQLPTYAIKRSWDYFVRHLLQGEPPAGYRMLP